MTKLEKLLARLERNPRGVSLQDFEALINAYGYIEEGGKHPKAIIGSYTRPYKRENPVKSYYVKELLEIIKSLE
jgi:hypothetical protein